MLLTEARLHSRHSCVKCFDDKLDHGPPRVCYLSYSSLCGNKFRLTTAPYGCQVKTRVSGCTWTTICKEQATQHANLECSHCQEHALDEHYATVLMQVPTVEM